MSNTQMELWPEGRVFDPHNEFDPLTLTMDGGTVWLDYCSPRRHIVITKKGENPRDVVARQRRHESN